MVRMIRFLAAGAAMLALVACGGGGDGGGKEEASYCQTWCGWTWDCGAGETGMGTREMFVLGCLVTCEVKVEESCPEIDEAACKTCLESSLDTQCIPLSESCAECNCLLPL